MAPFTFPSTPSLLPVKPEDEGSAGTSSLISVERSSDWSIEGLSDVWAMGEDCDFSLGPGDAETSRSMNVYEVLTASKYSSSSSENPLDITSTKSWLSSLPEIVCYNVIIDAYRLRIEDKYVLTGKIEAGSLYANTFPLAHFILFVELAREEGVLPDTWCPQRRVACEQVALDEKGDACILHTIDSRYILDKYRNSDPIVLEVLRMVADRVYGRKLYALKLRFFESPAGKGLAGW